MSRNPAATRSGPPDMNQPRPVAVGERARRSGARAGTSSPVGTRGRQPASMRARDPATCCRKSVRKKPEDGDPAVHRERLDVRDREARGARKRPSGSIGVGRPRLVDDEEDARDDADDQRAEHERAPTAVHRQLDEPERDAGRDRARRACAPTTSTRGRGPLRGCAPRARSATAMSSVDGDDREVEREDPAPRDARRRSGPRSAARARSRCRSRRSTCRSRRRARPSGRRRR